MEYSVGASAVAGGWSAYFVGILHSCGIDLPKALTAVPAEGGLINLPAAFIVLVTTALLVIGVKESTRVNRILVYIKIGTIFVFLFLAAPHIEPANWQPSCRTAFTRRRRHGCVVLCLPWFRRLVYSGRRNEKSKTGYADRHHCRSGYLYDFVHRRVRRYDRRRTVSASRYGCSGIVCIGIHRPAFRLGCRWHRRILRLVDSRAGHALCPEPGPLFHEPRRFDAHEFI